MGLSSSQARLLNLTSRMHQIEYKAAKLEAEKLQMANKSAKVYEDYLYALDKTKIQGKILSTDGSITYTDLTYKMLLDRGYQLKFEGDDRVVISADTEANFNTANGNENYFIALESGRVTPTSNKADDGVYEIYTADQLMAMSVGKNYRLMSNIDLTGKNWTSKSLIKGKTFDGNGYTITGLKTALFSAVAGTVKNLNVQGNSTSNAILANTASAGSTFENISVSGSVNSNDSNVGALIGRGYGSNITIKNCSTDASVISSSSSIGGLAGALECSSVTITNCSSKGYVQGNNTVGGFIGHLTNGTVTNCSSSASSLTTATGDGKHDADDAGGGFVGYVGDSTISNCEARGEVKSEGGVIGGFGGLVQKTTVSNCNAYGNVNSNINGGVTAAAENGGNVNTAGFVSASFGATFNNCNSFSNVNCAGGDSQCAGFVNSNMSGAADTMTDVINNCYSSSNKPFVTQTSSIDTINESATPNSNSISVTSPSISTTTTVTDNKGSSSLFRSIQEHGYILEGDQANPATGHEDDVTWLTNMINTGSLYIYKPDNMAEDGFIQVSVSTDTNLQEVSDSSILKKAEAKYEADMKKIDKKDRKYDSDLASLETERNAIKQEMETLKTVAKENVERTFRLFS